MQNEQKRVPDTTNMEPKRDRKRAKDPLTKKHSRNRFENVTKTMVTIPGSRKQLLVKNLSNSDPPNYQTNEENIDYDPKVVPKRKQNRCLNSSTINAKIGSEKDHEHHNILCVFLMVISFKTI